MIRIRKKSILLATVRPKRGLEINAQATVMSEQHWSEKEYTVLQKEHAGWGDTKSIKLVSTEVSLQTEENFGRNSQSRKKYPAGQ